MSEEIKGATMSATDATVAVELEVAVSIPKQRIADLLNCAFEGGSNYWYMVKRFVTPSVLTFRNEPQRIYRHLDYTLNEGGAVILETNELDEIGGKTEWTLDLEAIKRGLKILSEKFPQHFANFISENEDTETGDVFLQCCLFGNVELS